MKIRQLLIKSLIGAVLLINSGCARVLDSVLENHLPHFSEKLDEEMERGDGGLDSEKFMLLERLRLANEVFHENGFLSRKEVEGLERVASGALLDAGKEFIQTTPELNNLENSIKRKVNYGIRVGRKEKRVRESLPPEIAYDQVGKVREEEESSEVVGIDSEKIARTKCGIKAGLDGLTPYPILYAESANLGFLGFGLDEFEAELSPLKGIQIELEKMLGGPNFWSFRDADEEDLRASLDGRKGDYWFLKGSFEYGESSSFTGGVSLTNYNKTEQTRTRTEISLEYGEVTWPYEHIFNESSDKPREGIIMIRKSIEF